MHAFKPGDRVELVSYYSFWGEPFPQGTVIRTTDRTIHTKMDRNGKMIRLSPDDLQVAPPKPTKPTHNRQTNSADAAQTIRLRLAQYR
jgi:hypothetical protein